jgi:hypothetical protein
MTLPTTSATLERFDTMTDTIPDPQHRAMLRVVRNHIYGEIIGDLDLTMSTMPANPHYRTYGSAALGSYNLDTGEEVRAAYQSMLDLGLVPGCPWEDERWLFSSWGLAVEATCTMVWLGARLTNYDSTLDPDGLYLVRWNTASFFPFDVERMLMLGEIVYMADPTTIEPTDVATFATLIDTKG